MKLHRRGFTLTELMIVIAIIGVITAIAIPNLVESRKAGNEAAAVGALKALATAQTIFRESDKDGNGSPNYAATIHILRDKKLIEESFVFLDVDYAKKQGYKFASLAATDAPEYLYIGCATPLEIGVSGDRQFCTNQQGVIFYTTEPHIGANTPFDQGSADIDTDFIPLGK